MLGLLTCLKVVLAALAVGAGGLWSYHSGKHKQQQQPQYYYSLFPASVKSPYADLDLNPRGLFHSLPKKTSSKVVHPTTEEVDGGASFNLLSFMVMLTMAAWDSYVNTRMYVYEKLLEREQPIPEEEVEKIAKHNAIRTGLKTMTTGVVSMGLSKGVELVTGVDTETIDEVGEFVGTEVEKDTLSQEQKKERNYVSATKLVLKLGLVWLAYQGLKKLITYSTGYQCQCPALPASVVGTGTFSKNVKSFIEMTTRMAVKGLIASSVVMPLLGMKEPKGAPPVSDAQIDAMIKEKPAEAIPAPA